MKYVSLKSFCRKSTMSVKPRGFTLIVALIFTAVILSVSLSLASVAYNQVILASTAQQSEYAFYNADSALECALELDQKYDLFDYSSESTGSVSPPSGVTCAGQTFSNISITGNSATSFNSGPSYRVTTFSIPCSNGATQASVSVVKSPTASTNHTIIYSNGYSSCNPNDPQRVERGIESHYN